MIDGILAVALLAGIDNAALELVAGAAKMDGLTLYEGRLPAPVRYACGPPWRYR